MSMTAVIYLTAAVMAAVLALIFVVTRKVIRDIPGSGGNARALGELVGEIKRANDLAERRIAALEARVEALERHVGGPPAA